MNKVIEETRNYLRELGGKAIEIQNDTSLLVDGVTVYWKTNGSSKNIIKFNGHLPASDHLILHELTHLSMFINNTIANKGKLVLTDDNAVALLFSKFRDAWTRIGIRKKNASEDIASTISRCVLVYSQQIVNLALDLFVEKRIFDDYPEFREIQKESLLRMEDESIVSDTSPATRNYPPGLIRISRTANTVRALQVRDFYGVDTVRKHLAGVKDIDLALSMYEQFKSTWVSYQPSDEYDLVMSFAKCLNWDDMISIKDE